jgi:hypothetical protein
VVGSQRTGRRTDWRDNSGDGSDVFENAASDAAAKGALDPAQLTRVKQQDEIVDRPSSLASHEPRDRAPSQPRHVLQLPPPLPPGEARDVAAAAAAHKTEPADEDSDASSATNTSSATGVIGLVVEDPRARDRLKKHLTSRFRRLVDAPDALSAAALPDLRGLEALVFVRPRPDDATRSGIERLGDGPAPPRILIISSDARFDEIPAVSLRLPLGQRASEVAQQVLAGLRTLGVEPLESTDGE